MSFAKTVKVC